jgi:3-methyladenine DNA glycosylase AlkD
MPTTKASKPVPVSKKPAKKPAKAPAARMDLAEAMRTLEKAGTAQARKIYARHGATEPMFGVSFATLKELTKKIGVDHELALALWKTGNFDARNLAVKIVDPARMTPADLDRWAREASPSRMAGGYAAMLASETTYGPAKAREWLAAKESPLRASGWALLAQLANRDETLPDELFTGHLGAIERSIHSAPNAEREPMVGAIIAIGGRNPALRKAALAAAKRIGKVEVDHGETGCETPDAAEYIEKIWARAADKKYPSPAAQERDRDVPRRRC